TLDCPANRTGRETMNYRLAGVVAIGLLLAPAPFAAARTKPAPYAAALADPARPATDRERDAARLPGELLTFAQIDKGEQVGDYIMGGGYLTRILAAAV